jgi:hypothetical protein
VEEGTVKDGYRDEQVGMENEQKVRNTELVEHDK